MKELPKEEIKIKNEIQLTIIDIANINEVKQILDLYLVSICEGDSDTELHEIKEQIIDLFNNKDNDWKMGAVAELFIHLYMNTAGFKQECMFFNLEERSIKKGFDGLYSKEKEIWVMESKSGSISSNEISHAKKVRLAITDLENKISGGATNNPWRNAYNHACHCDIKTDQEILKFIRDHSKQYQQNIYHDIKNFNTIPCGTIFLTGKWNPPSHMEIRTDINKIINFLKGKKIHVICVTHKSLTQFIKYLNE